jgi:2-C-methyl-D-erythritol 4-phosphate cytidylyltransferase
MSEYATSFSGFAAVLPAGGLGKRMGGSIPKQMLEIDGRPIWRYSLDLFLDHPGIREVVLVVPAEWRSHFESEVSESDVKIVTGGVERWQSVQNGVSALSPDIRWVLVHDVARPFLQSSIIDSVLERVQQGACIVAKPVADTVKVVRDGIIETTIDRSSVWLAQTPQASEVSVLKECYQRMGHEALPFVPTDEASILERYSIPVGIVQGNSWNDKVTNPEDLERFKYLLSQGLRS